MNGAAEPQGGVHAYPETPARWHGAGEACLGRATKRHKHVYSRPQEPTPTFVLLAFALRIPPMTWLQLRLDANPDSASALEEALIDIGAAAVTMEDDADQPLYEPGLG